MIKSKRKLNKLEWIFGSMKKPNFIEVYLNYADKGIVIRDLRYPDYWVPFDWHDLDGITLAEVHEWWDNDNILRFFGTGISTTVLRRLVALGKMENFND